MTKRVRTTRRLEAWLKETSVALFVLNSQRRLVFFNVGCEKLTGWTAMDVLGQVCNYLTEADGTQPAALLASLAPPAGVWQGQTLTAPVYLAQRESAPIPCQVHFYPLIDGEEKVQATLGIIQQTMGQTHADGVPSSQRLHAEIAALRQSIRRQFSEESLIGRSLAMRRVLGQLKLARESSVPLLFVGETGSGREQLARSVHFATESGRRAFVPIDCRTLPSDHLEETLLRLTGSQSSEGLQPGTVYFNDIETLPRDLQALVLKLIESNNPSRPRVMAATRRSLEALVAADEFSNGLHFALTSLTLIVPPLRNRLEDFEPLAQFYLEELNRGDAKQVDGFHEDVWQQLRRYNWPGNVVELRAVVKEAREECSVSMIETSHLPFRFRAGVDRQSVGPPTRKRTVPLDPLLLAIEREQIELALEEAHQNKAKAAELLGITRPRLYRRMEALQIVDDETETSDEVIE